MNPMMLVLAMSAGQGPAPVTPAPQYPVVRSQAVSAPPTVLPGTLPMSIPVAGKPGQPPMPMTAAPEEKKDEPAAEEPKEEPPAPTVYLLERSLRDTWLGKTMADNGYRVYGWTAMSYTVGTTSNSNAPMYFNDRPNHFQMNQNWLHFEKSIDTSKKEFQLGFVTDSILPGTDARATISRGLFDRQLTNAPLSYNGAVPPAPVGTAQPYPFDLFQGYAQAFLPNLGGNGTTVKLGKFATPFEYEVVQAVDTPFVSKSYLFEYNPFTHTGVWAQTQLNDTWMVGNAFVLGADTFINAPTNRFTYFGQIKWAPPEGKNTALFNFMLTNPKFNTPNAFAFYDCFNFQFTHKFNDKASYVLDSTYSFMNDNPNVGFADWYGAVNYFIYKHNDKFTSTIRAEVFDDNMGVRTGFSGLYTEVTYGLAWQPKPGVILRPSVRYDNNSTSTPFEGQHDMWTGAIELILRW